MGSRGGGERGGAGGQGGFATWEVDLACDQRVNVDGAFHLLQAFLPAMRAAGGLGHPGHLDRRVGDGRLARGM